jgi:myo-inositol-1(or 4)-monophosphatase
MKNYTDNEILELICSAEREAAELILQAKHVISESKSSGRDIVTQYDRKVQELLVERFSSAVEGARFFCEENDEQDELNAEHVFIIDPIDGTMNFVRQFNHSCISVAYMSRGQLRAAAVYNPYVDEMFSAVLGQGAKLNGRPIHAAESDLSGSVVCCGTSPYFPQLADRGFALMKEVFLNSLDLRRQGSAALDLCSAASGRAGLYFELNTSLWDYAAGLLIVQEAGGVCLTCEGEAMPLDGSKSSVAAGSKKAVEDFLAISKRI